MKWVKFVGSFGSLLEIALFLNWQDLQHGSKHSSVRANQTPQVKHLVRSTMPSMINEADAFITQLHIEHSLKQLKCKVILPLTLYSFITYGSHGLTIYSHRWAAVRAGWFTSPPWWTDLSRNDRLRSLIHRSVSEKLTLELWHVPGGVVVSLSWTRARRGNIYNSVDITINKT